MKMNGCFITILGLIVAYIIFWIIENQIYLNNLTNTLIGTFVLDLERTNLGIYSDSVDIYKDLTIVFKKDKTFRLNKSVPFIADTMGTWIVGGRNRWSYIYFECFIKKYGKEAPGTPITEGYFNKGDTIFYINSVTPRADQLRKSDVHVVYFKRTGYE